MVASARATSAIEESSRSAKAVRFAAWPASAVADFADSTHGTTEGTWGAFRAAGTSGSGSGACSMIVCALVPLIPNDDTAARSGCPFGCHSCASVRSSTAPDDQSTCGDGASTCNVLGNTPWRIARTIFITPATPAAAWVWPMFDFTEPSQSGRSRSLP